ncbi:MAG: serine/threonine-protein kinase, partial [Verrucomicrobiota bacterium]
MLDILGAGGMGAVYKARQINLDRFVAIKILPSHLGADLNFAERFKREAQAMAKMQHPRIVAVHDFGEAEISSLGGETVPEEESKMLFIVMEYVEGTDLDQLLKTGALEPDQILAIVTQICDALHYAHDKGIVHRDIKPANIMLDIDGMVKVADFGLAKITSGDAAQSQLTMTNVAMGTPDYVAPEQLEVGAEPDHRADIYALGVMIYQMLTGQIPRGMFGLPTEQVSDLDPRLDHVVATAMQTDPGQRYQEVSQLWTDVDTIRTTPLPQGEGDIEVPSGAKATPGKKKSSVLVWASLALLLLFAMISGFVIVANQGSQAEESLPSASEVAEREEMSGSDESVPDAPSVKPRPVETRSELGPDSSIAGEEQVNREEAADADLEVPAVKTPSLASTNLPLVGAETTVTGTDTEKETTDAAPISDSSSEPSNSKAENVASATTPVDQIVESESEPESQGESKPQPSTEAAGKLAALIEEYREKFSSSVLDEHQGAVAGLTSKYLPALAREKAKATQAGNLDATLAWQSEIDATEDIAASVSEWTVDAFSIPDLPELPADPPAKLATLRATYVSELTKLEEGFTGKFPALKKDFFDKVAQLESEFTKAENIEAAVEIREASTDLASLALPFLERDEANVAEPVRPPSTVEPPAKPESSMSKVASGDVIQVTPDGGNGTQTIESALALAEPGTTIELLPGDYPYREDHYILDKPGVTILGNRQYINTGLFIRADDITVDSVQAISFLLQDTGKLDERDREIGPRNLLVRNSRAQFLRSHRGAQYSLENCVFTLTGGYRSEVNAIHCTFPPRAAGSNRINEFHTTTTIDLRNCILTGWEVTFLTSKPEVESAEFHDCLFHTVDAVDGEPALFRIHDDPSKVFEDANPSEEFSLREMGQYGFKTTRCMIDKSPRFLRNSTKDSWGSWGDYRLKDG